MLRRLVALALCAALLPAQAQGLPDLGDSSDAVLSDNQERTIGNRVMREVRIDPAFVDDPEISDYLKSLGNRLLGAADPPRRQIEFFVVQDDTINAFALIGGHIGVHTGLILLTRNEAELSGVVAHEIAHILQRHQSRLYQGQGKYQLASLAALALAILASRGSSSQSGQVTEAAMVGASAIMMQGQLDYTREHEREADRVGVTLLERAGYDPRGMVSFFERMQRANRLSEFKGAPSYLRTHPLTVERIADMQSRVEAMPARLVPDSFEYRIARAKIRAGSGSATEAVTYFRNQLADRSVLRPREDVYGLALALRRTRDFVEAEKELATIRGSEGSHPAFEWLAAQLQADQGRMDAALATCRAALKSHPQYRGLVYGLAQLLLDAGRKAEAIAWLQEKVRASPEDARLYELQSRAYAASGNRLAQHRAQAEAYFQRGNLAAAVDQLELATKVRDSDFYELSMAEARLRELRSQLANEREAEKALKLS
ncbi:MAG TPA: M48 family metalloprotease [Usitatibacteraceae bacterium]|nr:M48 family metalloprotease [Usitatibacteraceae bacterium]